jgi:hypothetical protein
MANYARSSCHHSSEAEPKENVGPEDRSRARHPDRILAAVLSRPRRLRKEVGMPVFNQAKGFNPAARICLEWIVKSSALNKHAFGRRLEGVERENLNPPAGLRTSNEWMGDVSTIPEAGQQNPGSDKTALSSASPGFHSTR